MDTLQKIEAYKREEIAAAKRVRPQSRTCKQAEPSLWPCGNPPVKLASDTLQERSSQLVLRKTAPVRHRDTRDLHKRGAFAVFRSARGSTCAHQDGCA